MRISDWSSDVCSSDLLVPSLRNTEGLNFDVMPMPTLDTETSVGDVSGLCMGVDPVSESAAADLIAHAVSADSVAEVAKAGYLVPANNEDRKSTRLNSSH